MIEISVQRRSIDCAINLPSSKSISNRLLIIKALSESDFHIENLSHSEDTIMLSKLLRESNKEIYAGEGGTTFRFLLAFLALKGKEHVLSGSERLNKRPVKELVETLNKLGASIEFRSGDSFPPLHIHPSSLHGGRIAVNASVSSQFTSALLLIAPYLEEGLELHMEGKIVSPSYIKMTIRLMKQFGIEVNQSGNVIHVEPGIYISGKAFVESDWSSAAYWMSVASLSDSCNLLLKDLSLSSIQGDAVLAALSSFFGVRCSQTNEGVVMEKAGASVNDFEYDFNDCPDLAPALALLCAAKGMHGVFTGIDTLREKESDRVEAIQAILQLMGGSAEVTENRLVISPFELKSPERVFPVFNDHRIAMSVAPLALAFGTVRIENGETVKKSYPEFWNDLKIAGFNVA